MAELRLLRADYVIPFGVHVNEAEDPSVVLRGELDISSSEVLEDALRSAGSLSAPLIVDASALTFMDAAGLDVLVSAHVRLSSEGRHGLKVRGASGIVRRVFEITGLTSLLEDPPESLAEAPRGDRDVRSHIEVERARQSAGLSVTELFVSYVALGGRADLTLMSNYLNGKATAGLDPREHDVAVHAVNERLLDLGRGHESVSHAADRTG